MVHRWINIRIAAIAEPSLVDVGSIVEGIASIIGTAGAQISDSILEVVGRWLLQPVDAELDKAPQQLSPHVAHRGWDSDDQGKRSRHERPRCGKWRKSVKKLGLLLALSGRANRADECLL